MMDRNEAAQTVTDLVEDLTVRLLISEHYTYSPHPDGRRPQKIRRTTSNGDEQTVFVEPSGPLPKRRPVHLKRHDPPLVAQLQALEDAALASAGSHEPVKRSKPGSRPPLNVDMFDTLERLTRDTQLWRDLYQLHRGREPKPAPVGANIAALRSIVLDPHTPDDLVTIIVTKLRSYKSEALIRLDYTAPMTTFTNVSCHVCGGALRARSDATGDVYCAGGATVEGPTLEGEPWPHVTEPCGNKYGRHAWLDILSNTTDDEGVA